MDEETGEPDPEAERVAVRRQAMDLLARREHACQELKNKLARHVHDADLIERVVAELADEGLQSDLRYAQSMLYSKAQRGFGPMRLQADLQAAGVDEAIVAQAMADLDTDWQEQARQARHKRFGPEKPTDYKVRAKQMRFLQRRGFDMDQIMAAFE